MMLLCKNLNGCNAQTLKLHLFLLFFFVNSILFGQSKWQINFEASVFRYNFDINSGKDYFKNSKDKLVFTRYQFDINDNNREFNVKPDTTYQKEGVSQKTTSTKDYRILSFGFSNILLDKKRFDIKQTFSLSYMRANNLIGNVFKDRYYTIDNFSQNYDESGTIIEYNLDFYEESKRIGLVYDLSLNLKLSPVFSLGIGNRNMLNFNVYDKFYIKGTSNIIKFNNMYSLNCRPSFLPNETGYFFYNKDEINKQNYEELNRKMRPQYSFQFFIKPQFTLDDQQKLTFYCFYGFALKTISESAYKGNYYNPTYGIGVAHKL